MKKDLKVPFTLNNTLTYEGVSYGPHKDSPTPVGLVLAILMLEGKNRSQAQEKIEELISAENEDPEEGSFEAIPHYEDLVTHEPKLDSFDKIKEYGYDNLTDIDGVGKVGASKIEEYVKDNSSEEKEPAEESEAEEPEETESEEEEVPKESE